MITKLTPHIWAAYEYITWPSLIQFVNGLGAAAEAVAYMDSEGRRKHQMCNIVTRQVRVPCRIVGLH